MLTPMENALRAAGYVKSPNNIHGLPGNGWYALGPGRMIPKGCFTEVRLVDERTIIDKTTFTGTPYVDMKDHHETVASFPSVENLESWLKDNGEPKYDGPVYNVWD